MTTRRGRRRVLTDDERVMWSAVTKSIAPMRDAKARVDIDEDDVDLAQSIDIAQSKPAAAKSKKTVPPSNPVVSPARPAAPPLAPLDRKTKRRVASGREAIDARFDLHGLTQSEAHAALLRFLRQAVAREARHVLVITGKSGVLRQQTPHWLATPEFRALTIGFETAHLRHGGEGALYVRLRRAR